MRPGSVLIVDEDRELREALATSVRHLLRDIEVRTTGDGATAVQLVDRDDLTLLMTVEESPAVDGLMIAACARRAHPDVPVIFLADRAPPESSTLDRRNIERVPRRPRLDRLMALVERMVERPGFRGEVDLDGLVDLLRMLAGASTSGALKLRHAGVPGTVWLEFGAVVHAVCGADKGVEALRRMLTWRSGRFALEREAPPERTLNIAAVDLVRECARVKDEDRALARGSNPGLHAVAAKHFLRGLELVRNRRFDEALNEWEQAARMDTANRSYREHLDRLREQVSNDD